MKTLNSHAGELVVDHTDSLGITEADLLTIPADKRHLFHTAPSGTKFESAVKRCCHCGVSVLLNEKRTREREKCLKCYGYICDGCAFVGGCTPIEKRIDDVWNAIVKGLEYAL